MTYNERQARFEPDFKPTSQLLAVDLASALNDIDGYGGTADDLLSDWWDRSNHRDSFTQAEVFDVGDVLARLVDVLRGLVK